MTPLDDGRAPNSEPSTVSRTPHQDSNQPLTSPPPPCGGGVCQKLQFVALDILHQLKEQGKTKLVVPFGREKNNVYKSTQNIARSVFLMDCILKLHHAQATESKRDLYYQNTKLFGSQKSVDKIVDDIACSIGVSRRHLRIVAKCKGLIHGHIQVRLQNGLIVRVSDDHKTILPINPNIDTYAHIDVTCIQFVLVVEKDAVFSRLVQLGYAQKAKCLLVTGKGYPDVATRLFLSRIARENPHLPVLCLVDGDPHGIDIFLIYKYGSAAMRHQCDELAVPTMEWIGLDVSHDYKQFGIPMCTLLEMGVRETKKAQKICDQMIPSDEACVQCLETMLKMLKKAEIEALSSMGFSFLSDVYLPQKVGNILVNRMLQDEDE